MQRCLFVVRKRENMHNVRVAIRNCNRVAVGHLSVAHLIALSILILMPFALGYPLLSLDLLGTKIDASVWKGIWKMAVEGYSYTAFMIFICAVLMPVSFAILVIMLQISKLLKIKPRNVLLFVGYIKPWVMFDVYLVALAVTMFKVREYATLEVDVYLIALFYCTFNHVIIH